MTFNFITAMHSVVHAGQEFNCSQNSIEFVLLLQENLKKSHHFLLPVKFSVWLPVK